MSMPVPVLPDPAPGAPRDLGGLLALIDGRERPLPLSETRVRARIAGDVVRTEIEQRFDNPSSEPLEVRYVFPLPPGGAVSAMELVAGQIVVRGECRERGAAEREFDEARRMGFRAGLLTEERADVYTLRVTRIPPNERVSVRLVVEERLTSVDGRYWWRFPTVVAPRFVPGQPIGHQGSGVVPDTDLVPDASRISPPIRLAGGTRLDLEVEIAGPVRKLVCAQHAASTELDAGSVRVAPTGATLDRDFVVGFTTGAADRAETRGYTDGTYTMVVVEPPTAVVPRGLPRDAVFLIDVSGSMAGVKLEAAKRALRTALRGLMPGDRFRLIAFGDAHHAHRPDFVALDPVTLADADRWIAALQASGGTMMLLPIQDALAAPSTEGRQRTVLFITDGQAGNDSELVAAVAHRRGSALFFTLGIDTAVNAALLEQLARVGGGWCELASPQDDIEQVVAGIEARFGSPLWTDVALEGLSHARLSPTVLFAGRPAVLLAEGAPQSVTVVGRSATGEVRQAVLPERIGWSLAGSWARERVLALEDRLRARPYEEDAVRPEILRVALAGGISSRVTAFVAVERSRKVDGTLLEVVQPVEAPFQWELDRVEPLDLRPMMLGGGVMIDAAPSLSARASVESMSRGRLAQAPDIGVASASARPAPAFVPHQRLTEDEGGGALARTQDADGSFGGDVVRTVAALLALVLLGHTRLIGLRRRTVLKAATWLDGHRGDPQVDSVLGVLAAAERGEPVGWDDRWAALLGAGEEGRVLGGASRPVREYGPA